MQYAGGNLTAWRWVMLVGMVVPSYWVGEGCALALEACIEWNFFENRRVLYYFLGTTVRPPSSLSPPSFPYRSRMLVMAVSLETQVVAGYEPVTCCQDAGFGNARGLAQI